MAGRWGTAPPSDGQTTGKRLMGGKLCRLSHPQNMKPTEGQQAALSPLGDVAVGGTTNVSRRRLECVLDVARKLQQTRNTVEEEECGPWNLTDCPSSTRHDWRCRISQASAEHDERPRPNGESHETQAVKNRHLNSISLVSLTARKHAAGKPSLP